jgi:cytochrome c peroxidase
MTRLTVIALLALGCCFAFPAVAQEELMARAKQQFQPIPTSPPELPGNPASTAEVELGKMLYFDPRLSASHVISCNVSQSWPRRGGR